MKKRDSREVPDKRTATKQDMMAAVVRTAVKRYRKRCWWLDAEDLTQEAWAVALSASRTWKPERCNGDLGVFYEYCWRAVVVQLGNYLWRQSAPVYAPQRKLRDLAGVHRAPETDAPVQPVPRQWSPDELVGVAQQREQVQAALQGIVPLELLELARAALADDDRAIKKLARRLPQTDMLHRLHIC